ncbi:MAG: VCBS repeat-containing protein, partial [Pseudomonadota bacterium]
QNISVYFGQQNGTFELGNTTQHGIAGSWWSGREKHVGDVNGDGRDDIITLTGSDSAQNISVYFGQQNGTFELGNTTQHGIAGSWWSGREKHVGDVNGDGRDDIITLTGSDSAQHATIYHGQQDGTFLGGGNTEHEIANSWWSGREKYAGDVDGDGRSDIIALPGVDATSDADVFIFENGDGNDEILDFVSGEDLIQFNVRTAAGISDLAISQDGADALVAYSVSDSIRLKNFDASLLGEDDFQFI